MNRPRIMIPLLCMVLALGLVGCASYTYDQAKNKIAPIPSIPEQPPIPTKMSEIKAVQDAEQATIEAESAARKAEAERIATEEAAQQEAEAKARQLAAQAETKRLADEVAAAQAAQRKAEEEVARLKAEADATAQRLSEQSEAIRLADEAAAKEAQRRAEEEAARLKAEAEAKARQLAEATAAEEAQRKAAEEAARIAAEEAAKLVAPVPDADLLTFPYRYRPIDEDSQISGPVLQFSSLLIPLPDNKLPKDEATRLAQDVASSIADIDIPVLFITGNMQNVVTLVNQLQRNAVIIPDGAIVTSFPVASIGENSVTVTPQNGKPVQLSLAYMPEYQVVQAFLSNPETTDWQSVVESEKADREQQMEDFLSGISPASPVLVGASLFEPSYMDWTSFTPVTYRSAYDWPLSTLMDEQQFIDGYRATHYSEETSAGTTIRWKNGTIDLQERIDYLYSKKLLPMETTMLNLGGLSSQMDPQVPNRYALLGTYIIP